MTEPTLEMMVEHLDGQINSLVREIEQMQAALIAIAAMPDEDNEWDGRDKFWEVRAIAQNVMARMNGHGSP